MVPIQTILGSHEFSGLSLSSAKSKAKNLKTVARFDISTKQWSRSEKGLNDARHANSVIINRDAFYVFGGFTDKTTANGGWRSHPAEIEYCLPEERNFVCSVTNQLTAYPYPILYLVEPNFYSEC